MEQRTVYVVTSGSYSDYGIDAVFDDEDLADRYVAARAGDSWRKDYDVEEWPLNPNAEGLRSGRLCYEVLVRASGDVYYVELDDDGGPAVSFPMANAQFARLRVEATDADHARKVAGEVVARMKADGSWPTPAGHQPPSPSINHDRLTEEGP